MPRAITRPTTPAAPARPPAAAAPRPPARPAAPAAPRSPMSAADRVRQYAATHTPYGDGGTTVSLPEGMTFYKMPAPGKGQTSVTTEFDVVPYVVSSPNHPAGIPAGETWYSRTFFVHRDIGPSKDQVICPRTVGRPCPLCEEQERLHADPSVPEDVAKAMRAKLREAFNVVDAEGNIYVLEISWHNFGKMLEKEVNTGDVENATFQDLVGGKRLRIRWDSASSGGGFTYMEAGRIDFLPRPDYDESVLDSVADLDAVKGENGSESGFVVKSYEELAAMLSGESGMPAPNAPPPPPRRTINRAPAAPTAPARRQPPPPPPPPEEEQDALDMGEDQPPPEGDLDAPADEFCAACEGTGFNTRGEPCPVCEGTGYAPADAAEPPPPPPPPPRRGAAPAARRGRC